MMGCEGCGRGIDRIMHDGHAKDCPDVQAIKEENARVRLQFLGLDNGALVRGVESSRHRAKELTEAAHRLFKWSADADHELRRRASESNSEGGTK